MVAMKLIFEILLITHVDCFLKLEFSLLLKSDTKDSLTPFSALNESNLHLRHSNVYVFFKV